jgi:hypothetical protein
MDLEFYKMNLKIIFGIPKQFPENFNFLLPFERINSLNHYSEAVLSDFIFTFNQL